MQVCTGTHQCTHTHTHTLLLVYWVIKQIKDACISPSTQITTWKIVVIFGMNIQFNTSRNNMYMTKDYRYNTTYIHIITEYNYTPHDCTADYNQKYVTPHYGVSDQMRCIYISNMWQWDTVRHINIIIIVRNTLILKPQQHVGTNKTDDNYLG